MTLKIVTFNLRTLYDTHDGMNAFIHRAAMILDKLREEQPHVVCFQECSPKIRAFLRTYLVGYHVLGHGRLEDYDGEGLCVAYREDVMELYALEQFWLSPTPHIPASRFEVQSKYPRTCTRVLLRHRDLPTPMQFFNVHLDHISDEARVLGIRLILDRAAAQYAALPCPTFILGDFNADPDSDTIEACRQCEAFPVVDVTADIGMTFHGFGKYLPVPDSREWKIDYIFATPDMAGRVKSVTRWEECKNGIYLSDHYPVCCEVEF